MDDGVYNSMTLHVRIGSDTRSVQCDPSLKGERLLETTYLGIAVSELQGMARHMLQPTSRLLLKRHLVLRYVGPAHLLLQQLRSGGSSKGLQIGAISTIVTTAPSRNET